MAPIRFATNLKNDLPAPDASETLRVSGMTCGHCARTVERAVAEVAGIQYARVDLQNDLLTYAGDAPRAEVLAAIRDVGYDIEES